MKYDYKMRFNPDKLNAALEDLNSKHPPTLYNNIKGGNRYGWAITSRTGKMDDIHGRRYRKYGEETDFHLPTKAYNGYFKEILDEMEAVVGPIYRARIIGIDGYREIALHHDCHDGSKFYRYHIPIVANPDCTFTADGLDFIMDEPGKLYMFPGYAMHAVLNRKGPRIHLMFTGYKDIKRKGGFLPN